MTNEVILAFPDSQQQAQQLAKRLAIPCVALDIHRFPDGESRVTVPLSKANHCIIYCSLDHPNNKLVELQLTVSYARENGCSKLTLLAPYMAYMRQDMAFHAGEVISQRVIGHYLSEMFDHIITVDPHLHRIQSLDEVMPSSQNHVLSAAQAMGEFLSQQRVDLLVGPDEESQQWVEVIASLAEVDFAVATKQRINDTKVEIRLPVAEYNNRRIVLVDDMISTGHTIIESARLLQQQNAASIDVLVTHALFDSNVTDQFHAAGISNLWSSDSVTHTSNSISLAATLQHTLEKIL